MEVLNFSIKRGQNEIHSDFAVREKIQGLKNLNVPNSGNAPKLRFPEFTEDWVQYNLSDCSYFRSEKINTSELDANNYISTENMLQNFQGISIANSIPDNTNVALYKEGDILISNIRPYLKKVWQADRNGGCSADVFVLKANNSICSDCFLHYLIANDTFINYVMSGAKGVKMPRGDKKQMVTYNIGIPPVKEQNKIVSLLSLLDNRIETQNKIIEDLKKLKVAIIENAFCKKHYNYKIGDIITQISNRNKSNKETNVLSVSNKLGFVEQSEQFEDRTVASEDVTNYKIVRTNDFAYNPARINVGSIARLKQYESGIVSPMYICFHAKKNVLPEYLEMFFLTQYFKHEMYKRLEGSVRLCLSFEGLTNIPISIPEIPLQKEISEKILAFETKIGIEEHYLNALEKQKQYLLQQMFI